MSNSIVYATRQQIPEIAEFLDKSWKIEYRGIIDPEWLDSMVLSDRVDRLLQRFDSEDSEFFIAQEDSGIVGSDNCKIIGAAIFGKSFTDGYPDDGEISAIYLDTNHIGAGLGTRLLTSVETRLLEKGYKYFILDVLAKNKRAITFYEKHGYKLVGETEIELGGIDYPITIMRKRFDS